MLYSPELREDNADDLLLEDAARVEWLEWLNEGDEEIGWPLLDDIFAEDN